MWSGKLDRLDGGIYSGKFYLELAQPQGVQNLLGCSHITTAPAQGNGLAPSSLRILQVDMFKDRLNVGGDHHVDGID